MLNRVSCSSFVSQGLLNSIYVAVGVVERLKNELAAYADAAMH